MKKQDLMKKVPIQKHKAKTNRRADRQSNPYPASPSTFKRAARKRREMYSFEGDDPPCYDDESCKCELWGPTNPKPPDYGYWLKLDLWSADEAILLLHALDPQCYLDEGGLTELLHRLQPPYELELKNKLENTIAILQNSILFQTAAYITPTSCRFEKKTFVKWAHSSGLKIPEPLKVLLKAKQTPAKQTKGQKRPSKKRTPYQALFDKDFDKLWRCFIYTFNYDVKKLIKHYQRNNKSLQIIENAWLEEKDMFAEIKNENGKTDHNAKDKVRRKLLKMAKKKQAETKGVNS